MALASRTSVETDWPAKRRPSISHTTRASPSASLPLVTAETEYSSSTPELPAARVDGLHQGVHGAVAVGLGLAARPVGVDDTTRAWGVSARGAREVELLQREPGVGALDAHLVADDRLEVGRGDAALAVGQRP